MKHVPPTTDSAKMAKARPAKGPPGSAATGFSSPLAPEADPDRWQSLVARINERARPILAARRRESVAGTLDGWRRPVLAGAVALAAAAVAVLVLLPAANDAAAEPTLSEAVVPWSVAAWVETDQMPAVEELVLAGEELVPTEEEDWP